MQTDDVVDETDDVIHDETCRVTVIVSGHNIRWNIYINTKLMSMSMLMSLCVDYLVLLVFRFGKCKLRN